ncbi:MAG: Plug domain-containing protein, partial [Gammaproteobacteria bacterium]|nr:Plug domain-containing protein [Gammaproteobacteria bacterium]
MKKILQATVFLLTISQCSVFADKVITDTNAIRYDQMYFAPFRPVTLIDMINKVPGGLELLKSASGNNARGFGSNGSQILIDGKRMSGKANDMKKSLSFILASQVDYIQLIRGTAEGLDVRSEGLMLNVVLKSEINAPSSNLIKAGVLYVMNEDFAPSEFLISHNTNSNNLKYGFSYQYSEGLEAKNIPEDIFNSDGTQREFTQGRWNKNDKNH